MNSQCQVLLDAHVAFELKQWRGKALNKTLKGEARAFRSWSENITLKAFSDPKKIRDIALRFVVDMPLPEGMTDIIGTVTKHLIALPVNRKTAISDVIDRALYDEGVELLVNLKHLREEIIRQSISSPIYATLVSEILYNGIRDYLGSENMFTQKVPGMSRLLKKGGDALSKRMPNIEERLRGYIEKNMQKTVQQSEKFLLNALNDDRIRHLSSEVWDMIQKSSLSVADVLNDEEVDAIVSYGFGAWLELRKTGYLAELISEAIRKVFKEYGDLPLSELLDSVGVTARLIEKEALTVGPQLIEVFDESGFLEATVRRRLEPFYNSKDLVAALK